MGRRGPRPKPTAVLRLAGSRRADEPLRRVEPKPELGAPNPATWLKGEALREWKRVAPELERTGVLALIDRSALIGHCEAWADFVTATRRVHAEGMTSTGSQGQQVPHPCLKAKAEASMRLIRYAQELGLSPSARSRIVAAPKEAPTDPLTKFNARRAGG